MNKLILYNFPMYNNLIQILVVVDYFLIGQTIKIPNFKKISHFGNS